MAIFLAQKDFSSDVASMVDLWSRNPEEKATIAKEMAMITAIVAFDLFVLMICNAINPTNAYDIDSDDTDTTNMNLEVDNHIINVLMICNAINPTNAYDIDSDDTDTTNMNLEVDNHIINVLKICNAINPTNAYNIDSDDTDTTNMNLEVDNPIIDVLKIMTLSLTSSRFAMPSTPQMPTTLIQMTQTQPT